MNNEDIMMPSEEAIKKMNEEYSILFSRKSLIDESRANDDSNDKNSDICILDFEIIAKAYCMESDSVMLLDFLMNKARFQRTRKLIYDIIKIKIKNRNLLSALCDSMSKTSLNYEPKISDNLNYDFLYNEILYSEANLLALLESVCSDTKIDKIMMSELALSSMLMFLRP